VTSSLLQAEGETLILTANRQSSFLTCSLRGRAIFGERDAYIIPGMANLYYNGNPNVQIGDKKNLFDWNYAGNLAHCHILAAAALLRAHEFPTIPPDDERVDGEAFFVTNDKPILFWDFSRAVFKVLGHKGGRKVTILIRGTTLLLARFMRPLYWVVSKKLPLTEQMIYYCCLSSTFNIEKAKTRLGYKPLVPMQEAIERSVKVNCP